MSTECKKNEDRNLYDLICKLIETGHYIETLSLYDGADDLVFAAKDLKQFIEIRVCYLVNRVGGIVMMTNSDGTPKLYEGDLDDVKKQDEVKEIETEEEN